MITLLTVVTVILMSNSCTKSVLNVLPEDQITEVENSTESGDESGETGDDIDTGGSIDNGDGSGESGNDTSDDGGTDESGDDSTGDGDDNTGDDNSGSDDDDVSVEIVIVVEDPEDRGDISIW